MKIKVSGGSKAIKKTVTVDKDGILVNADIRKKTEEKKNVVETSPKIKKEKPVKREKPEKKVAEKKVISESKDSVMTVNGTPKKTTEEKKNVISPIKFVTEEEKMKTMENILNHINEIRSLSGLLTDDEALDLSDMLLDFYAEIENRPSNKRTYVNSFLRCIEKCALLLGKLNEEEKEEVFSNEFTKDVVDEYCLYHRDILGTDDNKEEEETENEIVEEDEDDDAISSSGFALANATVQNMKDIDPEQPSKKILVLTDDNGNFILTSTRGILGIEMIDNRTVDSLAIVSREWLDQVTKTIKSTEDIDDLGDEEDDDIIETVDMTE